MEGNKKMFKKLKYPIFKLDEKYFIVIKDKAEIKEAKNMAQKFNAILVTLEKYISNK